MKKSGIVLILIILITSCRDSETRTINHIESFNDLKSQDILLEKDSLSFFLGRPSKIFEKNGKINIVDLYEDETTTIYDCEADTLIGRFFKIGQGPHDTSWPIQINASSNIFSIYERQSGKYREYDLTDLVSNKNYSLVKELTFEMSDQLIKTPFGFICTGMFESGLINFYDQHGFLINNLDPFRGKLDIITEIGDRFYIGQGLMSYGKKDNTFLYATYFTGDIFVYDYSNNDISEKKHIKIGKEIIKEDQLHYEIDREYLYHVLDVDNSNNNFYILYSLNPLKDDLKNYLLKINMNGEIENCYHIDKQIERFFVSDDDSYIMGIIINNNGEYEINKANF